MKRTKILLFALILVFVFSGCDLLSELEKNYGDDIESIMSSTYTSEEPELSDSEAAQLRPEFKKAVDDYEDYMINYNRLLKKGDVKAISEYIAENKEKSLEYLRWQGRSDLNEAEKKYLKLIEKRVQNSYSE